MKSLMNTIWIWIEAFSKARAAAVLARSGRYKEVQSLMSKQ